METGVLFGIWSLYGMSALRYGCYGFLAIAILGGVVRLALVARSAAAIRRHARSLHAVDYRRFQDSGHVMPVSLILPASDAADNLADPVEDLLRLEFRQYELIVVANSMFTDTWSGLCERFALLPFRQPFKRTLDAGPIEAVYRSARDIRLVVLDYRGGDRAGALNAGINIASYPVTALVYPDLRLTQDALIRTAHAFAEHPDCVMIGTFPRVGFPAQDARMTAFAHDHAIERLRRMYTNRAGYDRLGFYLPLSGTFCAFLKSAVLEAGGFSAKAKAENADLLLRIRARLRRKKRAGVARLLPDAICYEQPQKTLRGACAQQRRGQREMRDTVRRNRHAVGVIPGAGYTRLAERIWPTLELIGAAVALAAALTGAVPPAVAALCFLTGVLFWALQSAACVLLEAYASQQVVDTGRLLWRYMLALIGNLGFRVCATLARIFS